MANSKKKFEQIGDMKSYMHINHLQLADNDANTSYYLTWVSWKESCCSRCSKVQVLQDDQTGLRLAGYRGWQASCHQLSSAVAELAQTKRGNHRWWGVVGLQSWEVGAASIDGWMSRWQMGGCSNCSQVREIFSECA